MKRSVALGALALLIAVAAFAQAMDKVPKQKSSANEARNVSGHVDEDAQIEGILVINGVVSIDGVKIPKGQKKYRSAKTGRTYLIEWGGDDNVSVTEQ